VNGGNNAKSPLWGIFGTMLALSDNRTMPIMLTWVCRECGDGNLPPDIFQEVEQAETNEEVRRVLAMHEVLVKVCQVCEMQNTAAT